MPHVTQITLGRHGDLVVYMKWPGDLDVYSLTVAPERAMITEPGAFFQLVNSTDQPCEVFYIVTPAYLFEISGVKAVYDDSLVLEES